MSYSLNRRSLVAGIAGVGALGAASNVAGQAGTPASTTEVRVVPAANGDIEITGTPERIVAMEYELVEHLQTVGVTPVGVCERDSVNNWVNLPVKLDDTVVDLGTRDEPNLEEILMVEPDLILAAMPRQDAVLAQLEEIATTVQLEVYSPRSTPEVGVSSIDNAKDVLRSVALATNTVDVAEEKISEFDGFLEACAGRVSALGYAGQPFVYGSIILSDTSTVNLFTDLSRIAGTISAQGFENAVSLDENPGSHFVEFSLEQIGTLPDDVLFFYSVNEEALDQINATLESQAWQSAGFVQNEGVIDLGSPSIWAAGGLITLTDVITCVLMAIEMRSH